MPIRSQTKILQQTIKMQLMNINIVQKNLRKSLFSNGLTIAFDLTEMDECQEFGEFFE